MVAILLSLALAGSLEVSLQLPDSVEMGERFYADVLCSGSGSELVSVEPRSSAGLAFLGSTRSSSYTSSYIGSRRTFQSSSTVRFLFEALREGEQTVGPLEVVLGDTVYTLPVDTVVITAGDTVSSMSRPSVSSSQEAIWITTVPQEGPYYPGRTFSVKYYLYTKVPLENIQQQWTCPQNGVASLVDGADILQWRSAPGGASRAWILELEVAPALPGPMQLPRVEILARRFSTSPFQRGRNYHVRSEPVVVEVYSFPESSMPENFTGIADSISLGLSVPNDCRGQRGEVHARLTASGPGAHSISGMPYVSVNGPGEISATTRTRSDGTVTWDLVMRSTDTGVIKLGPDSVSWFDVEEGSYRQAVAEACSVSVELTRRSSPAGGHAWTDRGEGGATELLAAAVLIAILVAAALAAVVGKVHRRRLPRRALEKACDEEELLSALENRLSLMLRGRSGFMGVEELQDAMDERKVDPLLSRRVVRLCKTLQGILADGSARDRSLEDLRAKALGLLDELEERL
ncbi:hypothetical protein GF402_05390 [Candidatus Fermentibacteria bacterium]|nr:hypothetical protein [Candidatus Fermentibacteria bacterium]